MHRDVTRTLLEKGQATLPQDQNNCQPRWLQKAECKTKSCCIDLAKDNPAFLEEAASHPNSGKGENSMEYQCLNDTSTLRPS